MSRVIQGRLTGVVRERERVDDEKKNASRDETVTERARDAGDGMGRAGGKRGRETEIGEAGAYVGIVGIL